MLARSAARLARSLARPVARVLPVASRSGAISMGTAAPSPLLLSAARRAFGTRASSVQTQARSSRWSWVVIATGSIAVGAWIVTSSDDVRLAEPAAESATTGAAPTGDGQDVHVRPGDLPVEYAKLTFAPEVPPPIRRRHPVRLVVEMDSTVEEMNVSPRHKYPFWTYNRHTPGPFIRARVGDVMQVIYTNRDATGVGHNIDFHGVTGPGGGAPCLYAEPGEKRTASFKLLHPGLFVYHCAAAPVPMHVANGMYGLLLVEPEHGLPPVDREFYVMQSEVYATHGAAGSNTLEPSYTDGLMEHPMYVVFNGAEGALTEKPLLAQQNDRVRVYFGNAGPNLVSSFHIIGAIFDRVYREGDLLSPPARSLQTTLVPAGGAAVVDMTMPVPGNFTLVDHSIFRIEKGAVGFLKVAARPDIDSKHIYTSGEPPVQCPGCKLHN